MAQDAAVHLAAVWPATTPKAAHRMPQGLPGRRPLHPAGSVASRPTTTARAHPARSMSGWCGEGAEDEAGDENERDACKLCEGDGVYLGDGWYEVVLMPR